MSGIEVLVRDGGTGARVAGQDLGPAELEELIWKLMAARSELLPRRLPVHFTGDRIVLGVAAAVRKDGDGQDLTCILTPAGWVGAITPKPARQALQHRDESGASAARGSRSPSRRRRSRA